MVWHFSKRKIIGVVVGLGILGAGVGLGANTVLAAKPSTGAVVSAKHLQTLSPLGVRLRQDSRLLLVRIIAQDTGKTPNQVRVAFRSGTTLGEIAGSQVSSVEKQDLARITTLINRQVTLKHLTRSEADKILAKVPGLISRQLNAHYKG